MDKSLGNGTLDVSVTKKFGQRVQKKAESPPVNKRSSPRLREIPESKRPYYGHPRNQQTELYKKDAVTDTSCLPTLLATKINLLVHAGGLPTPSNRDLEAYHSAASSPTIENKYLDSDVASYVAHTRNDKARVKKTLRIYNKYYLHFFQEQNACENNGKQLAKHLELKQKDGVRSIKRPDLKAISKMLECNEVLFSTKRFGHLPGIDVGYQFYSRAEMVALGLHSHWLNDIDYMGQSYRKMEEFKGCIFPLAVAIVLFGQYEDDQDNSEDIVYTSQGGNNFMGNKHQEMSCGNLALKNSMEQSIPVRVVRGHTCGHPAFRLYTYDGLYKVSECWPTEGFSGFVADKYRLKRLEGQPKLTSNQVQYSNGRSSRVPIKSPQLVCLDIAEGQEDVYIPAINTIDDTTITGFTYTKYNQVASNLNLPPTAGGCECKGYCTNPRTCACARLNGFDFPYVRSNGGRLIEPKDVVFECGPNCGCGPSCINRISQRGMKYQLEVFRTSNRGWAVKTKDFIPSGAPVCEYIGELRRTNELDNVAENDYIFEIDCWQTMKGIGGRERRLGDVSESVGNELERADEKGLESMPEAEFCIDAGRVGNVARFINHSCDPNLFVQCVLSSYHDLKLARVVLFASDNIPPMQELTYDYGYELDSVVDSNGNVRMLACHCGTSDCRKRLY
ncbi:hypothetical protein L6452_21393 [Arctium lappa]|uniref:Uncharacterized protein n=1 Tax=Arctium lappa TaxID=4217 RepID=A0ACB9BIB7_ARCLA|nr:hypothetical protein L6452_21393 [Arctium lappa]